MGGGFLKCRYCVVGDTVLPSKLTYLKKQNKTKQ